MCFGRSEGHGGAEQPIPLRARRQEQRAPITIGPPQDVSIHIPRNRADEHGVPIPPTTHEMDRATLQTALESMAHFLRHRNAHLTIIAVGGAVNTILLQTRDSTHDVDIFGSNLDNAERMLLDEAMQYAIQRSSSPLGTDWLNTENQMWLSPGLHRELTHEAIQQNTVVFERQGLRVLAAPWEYAFSGKISRLMTGGNQVRPYDLDDAVQYLHVLVRQNGGRPVPISTVEQWAARFHHTTSKSFLRSRVNGEYRRHYGSDGVA